MRQDSVKLVMHMLGVRCARQVDLQMRVSVALKQQVRPVNFEQRF